MSFSINPNDVDIANEQIDMVEGSCVIGLGQLCKVAASSSNGFSGKITVSRLLQNEGAPIFNVDRNTFQVLFELIFFQ